MKPVNNIENKTPDWLKLEWINRSQIFRRLTQSDKKSKYDYLGQKVRGARSWQTDELVLLEKLRKSLKKELSSANAEWISLPWINRSEVFREVRESADKNNYDYLTQKALGHKSWKPEELKKLAQVKKKLVSQL